MLKKIQSLPETVRKIILVGLMILITLFLLILYFENVKEKIKSFSPEDFKKTLRLEELQFPSLELPKLEKFQIPTELQIPREFQVPK